MNDAPSCPMCGDDNPISLGALGTVEHFRCRSCGIDFHSEDDTDVR